ncbi:TPA: hypothetical protein ACTZ5N_003431 [Bacillus cereus]
MEKPQKPKKHYTFQQHNKVNTNYLEELFYPSGIGSLPNINKKEIQENEIITKKEVMFSPFLSKIYD